MAKASIKAYFEPTPKLFRKIGLAIASLGNTFGVSSAIHGYLEKDPEYGRVVMLIGVGACFLGWLGKEITNFFTENHDNHPAGTP